MKRISASAVHLSTVLILTLSGCAGSSTGAGGAAGAPQQMSQGEFIFNSIWFLFVGLCVYYLIVIQPELKREQTQKKFVTGLKRSDDIVTSGGIFGKVQQVQDDVVTVEIAANVRIRIQASHVKPLPAAPSKDAKASNS